MRSDPRRKKIVDVIAYCIMPGHLHIAIQELKDNSVSTYTANVLNSYARYFNSKYNRKGPLWESRTKKVLVNTDEQLLYLTMYIHLNPVAAGLVKKPEDWPYSSYKEHIKQGCGNYGICNYSSLININPKAYRKYVESNIEYQKDLARQKAISNTS
ncbi:MAG: transposase [Candidatus Omnitrophica bacterium]|nr:transposase [Candidatus Omnitrophota bacterium]